MRLLVAVALIVFVGLLDDSLAKKLTRRNVQLIVDKVKRIAKYPVLRHADTTAHHSTGSVEDNSGSSEKIAEECAQNGGPDAYADAETETEAALTQLTIGLDVYGAFATAVAQMGEQESFDPIVRYLCQRKSVIQTFTTSYADATKPCFDAETRYEIDALANLTNSFTEYLCQENGNEISEFLRSDGLGCIATRQVALDSCVEGTIERGEETSSEVNEIDTEDADCTDITAARNCIQTEMKKCPDPSNAVFVVGLIDFLLNQFC